MTDAAFADGEEHLAAELARLDLLLGVYLTDWRAERSRSDEFAGLYVSDAEVEGLLGLGPDLGGRASANGTVAAVTSGERGRATGRRAALFDRLVTETRTLRGRLERTRTTGTDLRLVTLGERFGLDRPALDALLLAVAPALDGRYERVYGYLQDDLTRTRPTVDLVGRVVRGVDAGNHPNRSVLRAGAPLLAGGLVTLLGDGPRPGREVVVDDRVAAYLLGENRLAEPLAGFTTRYPPKRSTASLAEDGPEGGLRAAVSVDGRPFVHLHGPYGSGMRRAVRRCCGEAGRTVLVADAERGDWTDVEAVVAALGREARLDDADLCVTGIEALVQGDAGRETDEPLRRLVETLDRLPSRVFLTGRRPLPIRVQTAVREHTFTALAFPTPDYDRRRALWAATTLPPGADPADLASKFRFTPGQVTDAVRTAAALARAEGREAATTADLYVGCRAQTSERLTALARKVDPAYGWDDIVLPADSLTHLREIADHVTHRGRVYADWGFEGRFSLGNGIVVLFTGPSGTGKTMAAEILAGAVGLDLFKIDLSRVVSKYIGETEKNLREIFDEAEDTNAVLLFDEADALFGKRSEVTDSHDRYANIEVNYLLQRVEEYDGVVVLTTNFEGNIDDAFLRRVNHAVDFPLPDREARAAIWRVIFPPETPVEGLDIEFLSGFDLAGGSIKNVALTAAFLGAADGGVVRMGHVLRALRREFQKTGTLVDPDEFGPYYDLLQP